MNILERNKYELKIRILIGMFLTVIILLLSCNKYQESGTYTQVDVKDIKIESKNYVGNLPSLNIRTKAIYADGTESAFSIEEAIRYSLVDIREAGNEGIYLVDFMRFGIWFKPHNGKWVSVINNVNIVKPFGGKKARFQVKYVSPNMFLVSETVENSLKGESLDATAEFRTMLIDGVNGNILKRSRCIEYGGSPYLIVPIEWKKEYKIDF